MSTETGRRSLRSGKAKRPPVLASDADAAVRQALSESHRDLLRFLQRRLGDREEAQEVLQVFLLKALERTSDLRNVDSVRGWLSRILATTLVDHWRRKRARRRRETELDESTVDHGFAVPEPELDQAVCACLYKLLPTLRPEYADVIWRADLLGEPRERIAIGLGTSVNNVTVRLYRARQQLRRRLEQMCLTCPVHGFLDCRCELATRLRRQVGKATAAQRKRTRQSASVLEKVAAGASQPPGGDLSDQ